MKKIIRRFAIELNCVTEKWVIPHEVYQLIDDGKHNEAGALIVKARQQWGDDPEITYADTLNWSLRRDS